MINKEALSSNEKKLDFQKHGMHEEGFEYFFQMAMRLKVENSVLKRDNVLYQEKLKAIGASRYDTKKESDAYLAHNKKLKEEVEKFKQRAEKYKGRCDSLMERLLAISPDLQLESGDNSNGIDLVCDRKLTDKPTNRITEVVIPKPPPSKPSGLTLV